MKSYSVVAILWVWANEKLAKLIRNIENIEHIKILRIHSRSIVVTPSRITDKLVKLLDKTALKVVLVTHINHANEVSEVFIQNIGNFTNITLLNQSVLLKGVNDDLSTLERLSLKLFDIGILPYYLHMLDKVKGAEHFFNQWWTRHSITSRLEEQPKWLFGA